MGQGEADGAVAGSDSRLHLQPEVIVSHSTLLHLQPEVIVSHSTLLGQRDYMHGISIHRDYKNYFIQCKISKNLHLFCQTSFYRLHITLAGLNQTPDVQAVLCDGVKSHTMQKP